MEVNKKQLADIFGASIRTIQNWQEQGMPVLRGGGKGNEVLYDSAAVIRWYLQVHTRILSVLVLIRTPLRLVHMDTPSPLTLLVTRKTPSKTSHLTIL
ncbi:terminase small subunit [Escherichia coli]|nr:terminase small subunit [Escherichia coli]